MNASSAATALQWRRRGWTVFASSRRNIAGYRRARWHPDEAGVDRRCRAFLTRVAALSRAAAMVVVHSRRAGCASLSRRDHLTLITLGTFTRLRDRRRRCRALVPDDIATSKLSHYDDLMLNTPFATTSPWNGVSTHKAAVARSGEAIHTSEEGTSARRCADYKAGDIQP